MALCRSSSERLLGGWTPLLCVVLGSLIAFLMPLVGVDHRFYGTLRAIAQLPCQSWWKSSQPPPAVQSTSLTVPFTDLDLLPFKSKPSKGTESCYSSLEKCLYNNDNSGPRSDSHTRLNTKMIAHSCKSTCFLFNVIQLTSSCLD